MLGEAELMAVMVMSKRKFQLIHGGVVRTADVLGERKGTCNCFMMHAVLFCLHQMIRMSKANSFGIVLLPPHPPV